MRVACAAFLSLKTAGEVRQRAVHAARRVAPVTVAVVVAFAVWTVVLVGKGVLAWLPAVAAVIAVAAAWLLGRDPQGLVSRDWNGLAFVATSLTIAMVVLSIFLGLYPRVMVSTLASANDLTVANTASSSYTLRVMTVVAVILLPVVLAYQGVDLLRVPAPDRPLGVSAVHAAD